MSQRPQRLRPSAQRSLADQRAGQGKSPVLTLTLATSVAPASVPFDPRHVLALGADAGETAVEERPRADSCAVQAVVRQLLVPVRCRPTPVADNIVRGASSPATKPGFLAENDKGMPGSTTVCVCAGGGLRTRTLARMSPSIQSPSTHLAPVAAQCERANVCKAAFTPANPPTVPSYDWEESFRFSTSIPKPRQIWGGSVPEFKNY